MAGFTSGILFNSVLNFGRNIVNTVKKFRIGIVWSNAFPQYLDHREIKIQGPVVQN